jgi:hypothetical protein
MNKEKLSVDFELLHLRLITKCQLLVQPTKNGAKSVASSLQSPPPTPPLPPSTPPLPPPTPPLHKSTSRIPTMSFTNSNRKINKQT